MYFDDLIKLSDALNRIKSNSNHKAHLIIPAFKIRPDIYLNLSAKLSLKSDFISFEDFPNHLDAFPVTIPRKEAVSAIRLVLGHILKSQKHLLEDLSKFKCKITGFNLIYIPFLKNHLEFVQPQINLAINRNIFRFLNKKRVYWDIEETIPFVDSICIFF